MDFDDMNEFRDNKEYRKMVIRVFLAVAVIGILVWVIYF